MYLVYKHLCLPGLPFITGAEKKTRTPDEQVNWTTAIHEAGHTIVGLETKTSAKNVYKVTIKSRRSNQSLGHVSVIERVGYSMVSLECGTYFYTKKIIVNVNVSVFIESVNSKS